MRENLVLIAIVFFIVLLLSFVDIQPANQESSHVQFEATYSEAFPNLDKGDIISWDWKIADESSYSIAELIFRVTDSEGEVYYESTQSQDSGSFTIPYQDTWTLTWENPLYDDYALYKLPELIHSVEILNQDGSASTT